MKDRYLWVGVFVVLCSMLGNYLHFQSKQLEQPIFLEHYYETDTSAGYHLRFYYLTNKSEPLEVKHMLIDGVSVYPINEGAFWSNQANIPNYEQAFSHHYLQSVTVTLPEQEIPVNKGVDDVWTFNEMQVTFSNGEKVNTNIGEVRVYGNRTVSDSLVSRYYSRNKNDNNANYIMVSKPTNIESITIPFGEEVSKDVLLRVKLDPTSVNHLSDVSSITNIPHWYNEKYDIEVNDNEIVYVVNENLYPIQLNTSDWLNLYIRFSSEHKRYYEFNIKISGTTDEGKPFEFSVPAVDRVYLTQQDVDELIAKRQGGL